MNRVHVTEREESAPKDEMATGKPLARLRAASCNLFVQAIREGRIATMLCIGDYKFADLRQREP